MTQRDMMGFGYVSNGGFSSSSSNLSPLAPPFTVDRSKSKTNTKPLSNFTEKPQSYGEPFSSSLLNWQYPRSSQPETDYISYCGSENDQLLSTALPSANDYSYLGSELNNVPSVHWASPNPNTTNYKSDLFSYGGGASKQCYAPYVSQAVDDNASLVGLNEANGNLDMLSTSGLVPVVGSSHVGYSHGLSSLECQPPWGGYWNGLSEGKRGKRTDIDGSFHPEGTDLPGSHAYGDYLEQGVVPARYSMFKENPTATESMHADGRGRERNTGFLAKEQLDSNLCQNFGFMPTKSSKAHIFGTSLSSHLEFPSLEPVAFSSNHHKSYSTYENGFQLFDSCISDRISVTKNSVISVIQPPISRTKRVSDTVASKSMDSGDVTDVNRKDGSSYNRAVEKEPLMPSSSDLGFLDANYLGFHTGRHDGDIITASSSSNENVLAKSLSNNSVDHVIRVREDHIPHTNVPRGFSLSVNNTEAFTANNTETSDQHNPAEDSPCWKGASASSFCPLYKSSKVLPQNLMMELEACNSKDYEMTQMFPPNNESVMGFSGEVGGPNFQKESLSMDNNELVPPIISLGAILPTEEHPVADPATLKSGSVQQNRSDRDQNLSNVKNQIKQHNQLNTSVDSGSIQSQSRPLHPKEVNFMDTSKIQLQSGDMDARISASDASEGCCIPLNNVENVLCSPPSEEDDGKPSAMELNPIMNVQTLVDALHNISELLVSYNFGNGLKEQCSKTLEHAIHNINLCLSKRILQSPGQELSFPKADISHLPEEGTTKPRLHAMNEVGNGIVNQLGTYLRLDQKRIDSISDTKFEKIMDFNSSRNEADAALHANMVQNIKVMFDENFHLEEGISPDTLLYKNLWLKAEAELCVTGLKARFDQVKIRMENCKSDKTKEDAVVDKIPSSGLHPDCIPNITRGSTPMANVSPKQKEPIQRNISSPRSGTKDVEASVRARYRILKGRGDDINTSNVEEESLSYGTDLGFSLQNCWKSNWEQEF